MIPTITVGAAIDKMTLGILARPFVISPAVIWLLPKFSTIPTSVAITAIAGRFATVGLILALLIIVVIAIAKAFYNRVTHGNTPHLLIYFCPVPTWVSMHQLPESEII